MIRKHKKYRKPRKMFDKVRIEEEAELIKKYGLKNRTEIWKAESQVDSIRKKAKKLITASTEEQEKMFEKLRKMGFKVENMADALALDKEDWLKRRLQSLVVAKKIANTPKQARQFIVHKHIAINKNIMNAPSYIVPIAEESNIELIKVARKKEEKE